MWRYAIARPRLIRTTKRLIPIGAIISTDTSDLLELIPAWLASAPAVDLPLGITVSHAIARAVDLRARIRAGEAVSLDLQTTESADLLHAVCGLLMDECIGAPQDILRDATAIRRFLEGCFYPGDKLEEREGLLRTLSFIEWRACRILDLPQEALRRESEYKALFRVSTEADVRHLQCGLDALSEPLRAEEIVETGPEAVFQTLLYLHEQGEAAPGTIAARTLALYRALNANRSALPSDLQGILLSEAARLLAGVLRGIGRPSELMEWLNLAAEHAQLDVSPGPQLARIELVRLTLLYEQSRYAQISKTAPGLDQTLAELGMQEDRVKCRIVWAASLKVLGRLERAMQILEPLKRSRSEIRPSLYGWVLLHSGDIYQLFGDYGRALDELVEAGRLLREGRQFTGLADVNSMISCIYRAHGRLDEAVGLLKSSEQEHALLGMKSLVANNRILIAETYLAMGRPREAEIEIRAALPILEEQGMLADAVIAVNLLREAIRQRKLDPQTLSDIRESPWPKT